MGNSCPDVIDNIHFHLKLITINWNPKFADIVNTFIPLQPSHPWDQFDTHTLTPTRPHQRPMGPPPDPSHPTPLTTHDRTTWSYRIPFERQFWYCGKLINFSAFVHQAVTSCYQLYYFLVGLKTSHNELHTRLAVGARVLSSQGVTAVVHGCWFMHWAYQEGGVTGCNAGWGVGIVGS